MELRGLALFLQELNIAKPDDPERFVMEDGLTELLDGIYHYGVQIVNLSMFLGEGTQEEFTVEMLLAVLGLFRLRPEECLMVGASDHALALAEGVGMASVGYVNPTLPRQGLAQAQIVIEGFAEVDFYFLERIYQRKHGIPWTVIETERCVLREMSADDLDALYELYDGREITRFIDPLHESREEEEEYVRTYVMEAYRFYGYGMWLAFHQKTGELIGRAGLTNREIHGETVLEMGYLVGERYQRQGYATELCRGILRYAQEGTGFREVNCLIQKENLVSVHLAENLGFSWREELDIFGKKMQRYVKILD